MTTLILVEKTDGERKNYALNPDATLAETRKELTQKGIMDANDRFLSNNAPVDIADETKVSLKQVIDSSSGARRILIGTAESGLEAPDKSVDRYNRLNINQKLALFKNIQIYQGLTASPERGFGKTFKPCINSWKPAQLPNSLKPSYVTEVIVEYDFNEVTHSMSVSNIDKVSASLNTPYGGGETSFEYARKTSTDSTKVTEYLTGKFLVNKVDLKLDVGNLQLVEDFEQQILTAVRTDDRIDQYANLINTLNERGYFVPIQFTLGGMLSSTSSTKISKFSDAESEKEQFSIGFKAAIDDFGGGGDYAGSRGRERSTSSTSKYSKLNLTKKGGSAESDQYADWAKSLNPAIEWDVIRYDTLHPTLALLSDMRLIRHCLQLMDTYHTYNTVKDLQNIISIAKYATQVESVLQREVSPVG